MNREEENGETITEIPIEVDEFSTSPPYQSPYIEIRQQQQRPTRRQEVIRETPALSTTSFATKPQTCGCPNCKSTVTTRILHEPGTGTWLLAGLLCLFGCWCGCQVIPFTMNGCKDVKHYCPVCNTYLGVHKLV